ncbi:MAG TPA: ribosomal protein L13e [Candidatus Nitrosopolaris sp.]|nr:ribosomal protein L13e [Candidatus Nitrosopolaris sp.]
MKIQVQKPIIKRWNRGMQIIRAGRGYSKAEMEEVGLLDVRTARNHGLPVDPLRSTNYPENVEQLKGVAKTIIDSRKPKTEKRESKKRTEIKRKTPTTKNKKSKRKKTSE